MNRIKQLWNNLRASLWFVPGLMIAFSIIFALMLIEVDSRVKTEWLENYPRLFGLGADGSRGMLTAIASSMLTVATLAFSLTLNSITQASGQFTPRIFRNFMRDRANQFVLGYFVSVFAYCLLVLRTIRGGDEIKFVPSFSILFGLLLALGGILVLIFFIHHIADSLQITRILENITEETKKSIENFFPEEVGEPATSEQKDEAQAIEKAENWIKIPALQAGYVQNAETDSLIEYAVREQMIIKMRRGIGQFVATGSTLAEIAPDAESGKWKAAFGKEKIREINDLFLIERHRTIEQDVGFGIRQIVDIALKALSPGVNDTTTAIFCIDHLSEILGEITRRTLPAKTRSAGGVVRLLSVAPDFIDYVETAFDQIRINGKGNLAIFERLITNIAFLAEEATLTERRAALRRQLDLTGEFAAQTLETDYEKRKVRLKLTEAVRVFGRGEMI